MKAIALVLTFAACAQALAAQETKTTPAQELAKVVAVEEQERDLAKAETLYREALAGKTLSDGARQLATQRLAALLARLGRGDEAKALLTATGGDTALAGFDDFGPGAKQDVEREKALREKARELVKQVIADGGLKGNQMGTGTPIFGIDQPVAEQLLWVGQPAVPEITAVLENILDGNYNPAVVRSLCAVLWRVGGVKAAAFLVRAKEKPLSSFAAETACAASTPEMLAVAEQYLRSGAAFAEILLTGFQWGRPLQYRLDQGLVIDVMGQGSVQQRAWLLRWAKQPLDQGVAELRGETLAKLLPVVRAALTSTEPSLGTGAQKLLVTTAYIQRSVDGLELLLEWLPNSLFAGSQVAFLGEQRTFDLATARRLLPKVDACIRTLGPVGQSDPRARWLQQLAWTVVEPLDASVVPQILAWADLIYPDLALACRGKVTAANAKDVLARFDRTQKRERFIGMFDDKELPPELFVPLRACADALIGRVTRQLGVCCMPLVKTGNPDAAPWLLSGWQRTVNEANNGDGDAWARLPVIERALLELGRRTQHEKVRVALRTMARAEVMSPDRRGELILALLSMNDEQALDLVFEYASHSIRSHHPYGGDDGFTGKPLVYLLQAKPVPPHGYSEREVLALIDRLSESPEGRACLQTSEVDANLLADVYLTALATKMTATGWARPLLEVAEARGAASPLFAWLGQSFGNNKLTGQVIDHLQPSTTRAFEGQVRAVLDTGEPNFAVAAYGRLRSADLPVDIKTLLHHRHADLRWRGLEWLVEGGTESKDVAPPFADVLPLLSDPESEVRRKACIYAGARVEKEAVPALIAALRDGEPGVRQAAEEALTKIRFFHEQQAHWDRVLKGLDASPASAVEKLLLQAKPGAPKDQRLLAITSLGTLGVPEALPFLIDWTQDTDAAIQKAVKDAITQIHLNPRK